MLKPGKSLTALAQELERIQTVKRDFVVPTQMLSVTPEMNVAFANGERHEYSLNRWSAGQLAAYSEVPKQYFDRLRDEKPELLAQNVNHGLKRAAALATTNGKKESRLVRVLDGKVRGFLSSRYRCLDAHDLLEATLPALLSHNFEVLSAEVTESRLYLKASTPKVQGEVKLNDVVQFGVMLSTSDVGAGSLRIEPFFYRLACLNGMVMETKFRRAHLGSNNAEKEIMELLSDETKTLNDQAFFATARDYLSSMMKPEIFQRELNKMKEATEQKITNFDLEKVVELTMNEVGVKGEGTKQSVLSFLAAGNEGAGLTKWGLANSFTRSAQREDIDYDTATELERAGGSVIDLSATSWKKIATLPA